MAKERLEYLDMAKGIAIIGVVVMHSTVVSGRTAQGISQMVMPLFFMVSGMLNAYTGEARKDRKEVVRRKARTLMLPFAAFSLLYILRDLLRFLLGRCAWGEILVDVRDSVTLYGNSTLWFLTTLFLAEIVFIFLRGKYSQEKTYLICLLLTIASYWGNGFLARMQEADPLSAPILWGTLFVRSFLRPAYALTFLVIGDWLFEHSKDFWGAEDGCFPMQLGCGVFLFAAGVFLNIRAGDMAFKILYFGSHSIFFYLFAPIVPFMGLLMICKNCRPVKPLVYFGKNSLIVMATHIDFYFLNLALKLTSGMGKPTAGMSGEILRVTAVTAAVLLLEVPCIFLINRYLPFLIGKTYAVKDNGQREEKKIVAKR